MISSAEVKSALDMTHRKHDSESLEVDHEFRMKSL